MIYLYLHHTCHYLSTSKIDPTGTDFTTALDDEVTGNATEIRRVTFSTESINERSPTEISNPRIPVPISTPSLGSSQGTPEVRGETGNPVPPEDIQPIIEDLFANIQHVQDDTHKTVTPGRGFVSDNGLSANDGEVWCSLDRNW
jgi:hypothetical protein